MDFDPDMTEMAERVLARHIAARQDHDHDHSGSIVAKGLMVVEFLSMVTEHRGVLAVQLGKQGPMQPWDVIGLIEPIRLQARDAIRHNLWGPHE